MFERKITQNLLNWKNQVKKKALIIEGARQVGKTFIIREFAKTNYEENVIEINFLTNSSFKSIFEGDISFDVLLTKIKIFFPALNYKQKVLLFLDEIQAFPLAIAALKSFSEQNVFDCIASGSLLGIHYKEVESFPVGYVERMTLYPLDFEEFLLALGEKELFEIIKSNYESGEKVEKVFHEKMLSLFTNYIVVGGFPEVVKTFVTTNDYQRVLKNQENIINDYKDDIAKYGGITAKVKAREVFDSIPFQLAKVNKKFQYGVVKKGGRSSNYVGSIKWLVDAGIVYEAHALVNIEVPLITYRNPDHFKVYLLDSGLLVAMLGQDAQKLLLMNELGIAKGAIFENVIATILKVNGHNLYYYERSSGLEIDFITSVDTNILAIEVKSGDNTKSKSLQTLVADNIINVGIRLSRKNFGKGEKIISLPLYYSVFL